VALGAARLVTTGICWQRAPSLSVGGDKSRAGDSNAALAHRYRHELG